MSAVSSGCGDRKVDIRLEHFTVLVLRDLDIEHFNEQIKAFDTHILLVWSRTLDAEDIDAIVAMLKGLPNLKGLVLDVARWESASTVTKILNSVCTKEATTIVRGWSYGGKRLQPRLNGVVKSEETG
jgi:hypothetical protein